jgi:hypothetical protein
MHTTIPALVRRHCNCLIFMIGAFGMTCFAVGLGLSVYSVNLGHELSACQVRTSTFSSSSSSFALNVPRPQQSSGNVSENKNCHADRSSQSRLYLPQAIQATPLPVSMKSAAVSSPASAPTSVLTSTAGSASSSTSASATSAALSSATRTHASGSSSSSQWPLYSTLLGDRKRFTRLTSISFASTPTNTPSPVTLARDVLHFNHQRRQVFVHGPASGSAQPKAGAPTGLIVGLTIGGAVILFLFLLCITITARGI